MLMNKNKGLTLIELVLTVALLAILSTFIVTHMLASWDAAEKNITQIHAAVTANNIFEHLLATSTPVTEFLGKLPYDKYDATNLSGIAKDSIYHAGGVGRLGIWKAGEGPASFSLVIGDPQWKDDVLRVSFPFTFFVHNP
jgi:prepilin-type N-terminal cleavage/methylation domain-containing protein